MEEKYQSFDSLIKIRLRTWSSGKLLKLDNLCLFVIFFVALIIKLGFREFMIIFQECIFILRFFVRLLRREMLNYPENDENHEVQ